VNLYAEHLDDIQYEIPKMILGLVFVCPESSSMQEYIGCH